MHLRLVLVLICLIYYMPAIANYEHFAQGETKIPEGINPSLEQRDLDLKLLVFAGLGDFDKVQELLNAGANPNTRDQYGITALHWAAHSGHPKVVSLLIKQKANTNARTIFGETISSWAINEEVKTTLNTRPYAFFIDSYNLGNLRSHYYGFYGFWENQHEIELNRQLSESVIHFTGNKVIKVVSSLISEGANTGIVNRNIHITANARDEEYLVIDDTPLHLAISNSNVSGVRILLKNNRHTHFLKRQFLLSHNGNDVEYKISIESPLHLVQYDGSNCDMTILQMLLEANEHVNVNTTNQNKETPIYQAIEHENIGAINLLLNHKAEINIYNHQRVTPLHLAALKNNFALVSKFIKLGASPNAKDHKRKMPSQMTTDIEIERWLLSNGASSYASFDELSLIYEDEISHLTYEDRRQFMLFASVKYGSLDAIKEALSTFPQKYAINKVVDSSGRTLLHWVAIRNDLDLISFIIGRGIDPNVMDLQGRTPLDEAKDIASTLLLNEKMKKCLNALMAR